MLMKKNEVVEYLKNNYNNIGTIKNVRLLKSRQINSINYVVRSSKGQFILRNYTDGSPPEKIEKMCKILKICSKKNKVPEPLKNTLDRYVNPKKKLFLTKYYNGHAFAGKNLEFSDVARNLAKLHKTLRNISIKYNYQTNSRFYKILSDSELKKIELKINQKKNKSKFDKVVYNEIKILSKYLKKYQKTLKKIKRLDSKKQLIHHDLHSENIIFGKSKVVVIIDFNSMRKSFIIDDIVFTSFRLALKNSHSVVEIKNKIQLFLKIYQQFNNIDVKQLRNIKFFLLNKILERLSYILRKRYFANSDLWSSDFRKYIKFLKLVHKIDKL